MLIQDSIPILIKPLWQKEDCFKINPGNKGLFIIGQTLN